MTAAATARTARRGILAPSSPMAETKFTSKQVASGSAWTLVAFGTASAVRLVSSLVLTRALPDATAVYGVMALVFGFYGGLLLFSDFGIGLLLTQNPRGMEPAFRHTAFTAQIIRGVLVWIAAMALAPLFASAYPDFDGLQELLSAIAFSAVIGGFCSTSFAAFRRRMQVNTLAKLELAAQLFGVGVTITHALLSPSAWCMVSGTLASSTLKVVLSHWLNDRPDRIRWNPEAASLLKTVGRWVFLGTALTFCTNQADRLVFGKLISKQQLGVYAVAIIYSNTVVHLLQSLCTNVLYPMLCQNYRNSESAEIVLRRVGRPIVSACGFALTCLCGGGSALMQFFYEGDFALGGWMLQITACGAWFGAALCVPRNQVALSMAKPKFTAASNLGMVLAMGVLIPLGHAAIGFPGAVAGFAAANVVRYIVIVTCNRRLGVGALDQDLRLSLRFFAASAAIIWIDGRLQEAGVGALLRCLAVGAVAGLAWLPLLWSSYRDVREARRKLA